MASRNDDTPISGFRVAWQRCNAVGENVLSRAIFAGGCGGGADAGVSDGDIIIVHVFVLLIDHFC